MDVADIIDALGGPGAIAGKITAETGIAYSVNSVHWWKYRATIPPGVWPHLLELAAERGAKDVTIHALVRHWQPRKRRGPKPQGPQGAAA